MDALQGRYRPETYIIGFTENRYSSMDDEDLSPSPDDHLFGYNSPALNYAERTNKGAENIFLDKSLSLERERHRSVGKINTDILDIVYELTKRRKTPFLNRTFKEDLARCDSQLSSCSSVSLTSSSSGTTVFVQQLPPRDGILPYIKPNAKQIHKQKKGNTNKTEKGDRGDKYNTVKETLPRLHEHVNTVDEHTPSKKENIQSQQQYHTKSGETNIDAKEKTSLNTSGVIKWQLTKQTLEDANQLVRGGGMELDRYKGRYHTPGFRHSKRTLSYCQSSYDERTERERIDNIRRRHISQARTGPLDFNKLKRQITVGRSKSFVF